MKRCNICLSSKAVRHKPYGNLQFLPIPIHQWKDLSMDFVTSLPLFADWKGNNYNLILVIVDQLTKIIYYELVKDTINALGLAGIILDIIV